MDLVARNALMLATMLAHGRMLQATTVPTSMAMRFGATVKPRDTVCLRQQPLWLPQETAILDTTPGQAPPAASSVLKDLPVQYCTVLQSCVCLDSTQMWGQLSAPNVRRTTCAQVPSSATRLSVSMLMDITQRLAVLTATLFLHT